MEKFELHGHSFQLRKLSAFEQLHLSRKVAPLLPPLAPLIIKMTEKDRADPLSANLLTFAELAGPFADALSSMKDQDAEDIFTLTLSSVDVLSDARTETWIRLWPKGARSVSVLALDDIGKLLPIVVRVIIHNLSNFMDGLLTKRGQETPESNGAPFPAAKTS